MAQNAIGSQKRASAARNAAEQAGAVAADQGLGHVAGAPDDQRVQPAHQRGDDQPDDMRRAAVHVLEPVAAERRAAADSQQRGGQKPREPARLGIGQIDQPRRRIARTQQDPHDDAGGSPADQDIKAEQQQAGT